jgi:hypothetical protein
LCCKADCFEGLLDAVLGPSPELLRDNGIEPPSQAGAPVEITMTTA